MAEAWIVALVFAVCLFLLLITDLVVAIVVDLVRLIRRVRA